MKNLTKDKLQSLQSLGVIYFIYLFIYSGLEFTVTFLMFHKFGYTSIDQAKMFLTTGVVMAVLQGSVVRRLPNRQTKKSAVFGLYLIVPAFILVGLAGDGKLLYAGMILFAICKLKSSDVCARNNVNLTNFCCFFLLEISHRICGNVHDNTGVRLWSKRSKGNGAGNLSITWCLSSGSRTNCCVDSILERRLVDHIHFRWFIAAGSGFYAAEAAAGVTTNEREMT